MSFLMQWWVWGLAAGVVAPWLLFGRSIRIGFEERGAQGGLGAWSGMCWITVPLMVAVMYGFHLVTGK